MYPQRRQQYWLRYRSNSIELRKIRSARSIRKEKKREGAASRGWEENFRLKLVPRPRASFPVVARPTPTPPRGTIKRFAWIGIGEWKRNVRKSRSNRPTCKRIHQRV